MTKRGRFTPDQPDLTVEGRIAIFTVALIVGGTFAWAIVHDMLVGSGFPLDLPPVPQLATAIVVATVPCAALITIALARTVGYRRALAAQALYDELARITKLEEEDARKGMHVHARHGFTPVDVTLRADARTRDAVRAAEGKVAAAFAAAVGEDEQAVTVQGTRKGVRIRLTEGPRTPVEPARDEVARDTEPVEAPEPVVRPRAEVAARINDALAGALDSDAAQVKITETTSAGAPLEVWVEYPPRLTSKVGERLLAVRDTIGRVLPPTGDEWTMKWQPHHDRIVLRDAKDPLAVMVPLPEFETNLDPFAGPLLGITEGGTPFRLPLMGGVPTLVAGATGSGKGSILWNIIRSLAPRVADGTCRLWLCDPKGGAELDLMEEFAHRFAVDDLECIDLLEAARDEMKEKAKRMRAAGLRKIEAKHLSREFPLDLVVIDELASLTENSRTKKLAEEYTGQIAREGRAPAFSLVSATQDPKVKSVPNRSVYTQAVALRLNEAAETNMVLGQGVRASGAIADLIPEGHPGIGYVTSSVGKGTGPRTVRFRAAFVDDPDIEAVVDRLREARRTPPALGAPIPPAVQPQLEEQPAPARAAVAVKERPKKATTGRGRSVTVEQLAKLLGDDPLTVILDGDEDEVTVTDVEESPDVEGDWRLTYRYQGDKQDRAADLDGSDRVTLLT